MSGTAVLVKHCIHILRIQYEAQRPQALGEIVTAHDTLVVST